MSGLTELAAKIKEGVEKREGELVQSRLRCKQSQEEVVARAQSLYVNFESVKPEILSYLIGLAEHDGIYRREAKVTGWRRGNINTRSSLIPAEITTLAHPSGDLAVYRFLTERHDDKIHVELGTVLTLKERLRFASANRRLPRGVILIDNAPMNRGVDLLQPKEAILGQVEKNLDEFIGNLLISYRYLRR